MKFKEAKNVMIEFFAPSKVRTVEEVWQKTSDGQRWMWILILHNLNWNEQLIIHSKFILKTDLNKEELSDSSFTYLYDINCGYKKVQFQNSDDFQDQLTNIVKDSKFGEDLKKLSNFLTKPTFEINSLLKKRGINDWSLYDFDYSPKFPITKCQFTRFDFKFNLNGTYDVEATIRKLEDGTFDFELVMDKLKKQYVLEDLDELPEFIALWIEQKISKLEERFFYNFKRFFD